MCVYWLQDKFISWTQHHRSMVMRLLGMFEFLYITEEGIYVISDGNIHFALCPCWCYVIVVFVDIFRCCCCCCIYLRSKSVFPFPNARYIVADEKFVCCVRRTQFQVNVLNVIGDLQWKKKTTEKHVVVWMLTSMKSQLDLVFLSLPFLCFTLYVYGILWIHFDGEEKKISAAKKNNNKIHHAQLQIFSINHVYYWERATNQNTP